MAQLGIKSTNGLNLDSEGKVHICIHCITNLFITEFYARFRRDFCCKDVLQLQETLRSKVSRDKALYLLGSAKMDDDDHDDGVRIGNKKEGGVGGKQVHILSLEWNGSGLIYSMGEFKLSTQYQAVMEAFIVEK